MATRKELRPVREEARRLRQEERLSAREIHDRLGGDEVVTRPTITRWVKDIPLTDEELQAKWRSGQKRIYEPDRQQRFWDRERVDSYSTQQKGKIAEAAVTLRCAIYGCGVFVSPFDGDTTDRLVETPDGRLVRLQVRWCGQSAQWGAPKISLVRVNGRGKKSRFEKGDFDFLVGYDFFSDNAYVFSWEEVRRHKSTISVTEGAKEAWHKILDP